MSLVTLIAEEWGQAKLASSQPYLKLAMFSGLCLGTFIMVVLAIWA